MFASSSFSFSFFSLVNFCRRKHSFQVCPLDFPGLCFLHHVQVLDFGEDESEFPFGFLPFFLLPKGIEVYRAVLSSGSDVSISISCCLTSTYNNLSFLVRFSTAFLWYLPKKPNKKSLPLSSFRKFAKVVQYEPENPFESFSRWSHWKSNLDIQSRRPLPEY